MSKRTNEFPVISQITDADTLTGVQAGNLDVNVPVGMLKTHITTLADAGNFFPTDTVEAALQQLGAASAAAPGAYQPVDSDLTAIAALTTTAFGRNLLTLVDGTGVLTSIGAQPLDSDLTAIAALATTAFGRSLLTQANADGALALLGGQPAATAAPVRKPVKMVTTDIYTPVLTDENTMVGFNGNNPITVTLPGDTALGFPVGGELQFLWWGVGKPSFVQDATSLIAAAGPLGLRIKNSVATAKKIGPNNWLLYGDLG